MLHALDQRLGLIDAFAPRLRDPRQSGKVRHTVREMVAQRIMAMARGYPDGNDAARLATDPLHKLLVNRHPTEDPALASQPTLSRFENAVGPKDLFRLGEALLERVVEHHGRRLRHKARLITIDLDATDDQTHGGQLSLQSEKSERVYGEVLYQAGKWKHKRRVIIRAEVVRYQGRSLRNNPRFVVTSIPRRGPRWVYERIYCQRGDKRESDQGAQGRSGLGPHELFELLGEPVPGAAHGRCLRAPAGVPSSRRGEGQPSSESLDPP
ncbi:MAG: transposase [Candidatus Eisenbacteria bacterium]|nr:transposase [Candidatus Eisenbacteria bacterium]